MTTNAFTIFEVAFNKPRQPRSEAYKLGVKFCLQWHEAKFKLGGSCPYTIDERHNYPQGSAEFDAYYAGVAEGCDLWKEAIAAGSVVAP